MTEAAESPASIQVERTAVAVANRIEALPVSDARQLVAVAGPPASGKSTLAASLVETLVTRGHEAVLMPMDGFHLDNRLLETRGLLARKGAPETFDFGGFLAALRRVQTEKSVILPIFDRTREIAIAGAQEIRPETRIVVVEGNYLCLDEDPWRDLMPFWALSVFLEVPLPELEARLMERWLSHGHDRKAAAAKVEGNDMMNARRVLGAIGSADLIFES